MTFSYSFLVPLAMMLTLVSCWLVPRVLTIVLAVAVIGFGLIADVFDLVAIPPLMLLAGSGWLLAQKLGSGWITLMAGAVFVMLSIGLAAHWLPGFNNVLVLSNEVIKENSAPYTLYFNVDKPWVALVILLSCTPLLRSADGWKRSFHRALLPFTLMLPVVFGVAMILGFVSWEPEWPAGTLFFLISNLLLTSLAEAAFFRGFIQKSLSEHWCRYHWGSPAALIVTAVLFGLAHYPGGPVYMALVTLAGLFYGWCYQRTGSIEVTVFSQWLVNSGHFLFFTYPYAVS